MPYFALPHVQAALTYMVEHTHPTLMSVLAMLRENVPASDKPDDAVPFGSTTERKLMDAYFRPRGGPDDRPYFVPLGSDRGTSRWRETTYPAKSLQRQRSDRGTIFRQHPTDNRRWTFSGDLSDAIAVTATEVVGQIPIEAAYVAAWCYHDRKITSVEAAVADFAVEFHLADHGLVPSVFSIGPPAALTAIPLSETPIDDGQLLLVLQAMEPDKEKPETEEEAPVAAAAGPTAKVHLPAAAPGDWNVPLADLDDLYGLKGLKEPATRAVAALAAGMHVILTGPPGSGKTTLAECISRKAGFPTWTVPATDQWTTFETIGGYFPVPTDGGAGDRLDFLPGAVVDSLEKGRCLIIDEINRADMDKAFGELFTLLSGNSVTLPYRRRSSEGKFRRVRLQVGSAVVEDEDADVVVVPSWWRIVGSMNDADKASLKRLSMAFVRRFAFIPVDLPQAATYEALIRSAAAATDAAKSTTGDVTGLTTILISLFGRTDGGLGGVGLPLGPAFPLAVITHADSEWRLDPTRDLQAVLASALELYVLPQLQGRPDLHEAALDLLGPLLPSRRSEFARHLAVWTGYLSG